MSTKNSDSDLLAAFRHNLRRKLWRLICESTAQRGISPRELATNLKQPLSNVSYHVRVLADAAAITCIKTVPVRGSVQHFYKPNPDVAQLDWVRLVTGVGAPTSA